jgi:hypothetical protein
MASLAQLKQPLFHLGQQLLSVLAVILFSDRLQEFGHAQPVFVILDLKQQIFNARIGTV